MDLGLKDRRALVTAASRVLGRACAAALVAEGAHVFISSRDPASIEAAGKAIKATGWAPADVSQDGAPEALVEQARARTGIQSDTDLIEVALANLAVADDYPEWLLSQRASLSHHLDLEF